MRVSSFAIAVLLLVGCASSPPAPPVSLHNDRPTVVPLRAGGGHLMVRTAIDGRDAGWFVLDTASNTTAVERGTANRLDLPVIAEAEAHGIAGAQTMDIRAFQSVSVGGFRLRPQQLASLNLAAMRSYGARWAGLLGFDALADETFTIDARAGTLTIGDTLDASNHVQRMTLWNGLPVVEADLAGHAVWLLLDSGSDRELSLHLDVARRWPDVLSVPDSGAGRSGGIGGSVEGALTWVKRVTLLGVTLRDVTVSIDPRPPSLHEPRIAGRVGNPLLRHYRITFDARGGRIAAQWLPITGPPAQP